MILSDHRVIFLYAARGAPCARFVACHRGADEAVRLYLTPGAHSALHAARLHLPDPGSIAMDGLQAEAVEAWPIDEHHTGLAMVLRSTARTSEQLLAQIDVARLRGPLWPGQDLPVWHGAVDSGLCYVLDELVPGTPVFGDKRVLTLLYAAFAKDPGPDVRYALTMIDPPGMPPAPPDVRTDALRRHAWRRWEFVGTTWSFTHYSAACVVGPTDASPPPTWLGPLFSGIYLDMASWVLTVATTRAVNGRRHGCERFSEQDQGRAMARAWLAAIEEDRGDLDRSNGR